MGLSPSQYGWVWTQKQFTDALSYAALQAIETEVKRLNNKGLNKRVTNKSWAFVQELYKNHPEVEPAYTRPFYDGLNSIGVELSNLRWGETLTYDYQQFIKHVKGLDPNTHLYGKDNATSELKILTQAISLLDGSVSKAINLDTFDDYEEKIYTQLLSTITGSRLWA